MKKIKVIILIFSLIAGLVATYMIVNVPKKQEKTVSKEQYSVVVAAKKIEAESRIEADMLQVINVSAENQFNSFKSADEVVGKIAQSSIYPNEVISKERIINNEPSAADRAKREYRIKVDSVCYGGVTPGSSADILWTGTISLSNQVKEILGAIVYEDVLVKAVLNEYEQDIYSQQADKYNKGASMPDIVVLSVSQEQAQVLDFLKAYSGKEKAFSLAKYTESSKPLGNENDIMDIFNILDIEPTVVQSQVPTFEQSPIQDLVVEPGQDPVSNQ